MQIAKVAALAAFGLLALSGVQAAAEPWSGYVVSDVNERAGPSTVYPAVIVIPAWAPVVIYGCLEDYTWCDISWGPDRGWVAAAYIQVSYDSRPVPLEDYIAPLGIPIIAFDFDTYWGDYYRDRPFFGDSYRWRHQHVDHFMQPPPPNGYPPPPNGQFPPPNGQYQPPNGQYPSGGGYPPNGPNNFNKPPKPYNSYKTFNNNGPYQNGPFQSGQPPKNFGGPPSNSKLPPGCRYDHGQVVCPP